MTEANYLSLSVHLQLASQPAVLDLSSQNHFDILLETRRGSTDLSRPMTILKKGSLFDIPFAFSNGLLTLKDEESGECINLKDLAPNNQSSSSLTAAPNGIVSEEDFIILPVRKSKLPRFHADFSLSLGLGRHLAPYVISGHRYRVELGAPSQTRISLHVSYWTYGNPTFPLQPLEQSNLVASQYTQKSFLVVDFLLRPPLVTVSITASPVIYRSATAGNSPPTIRFTITNQSDRAVTVKSSGDQSFISPFLPVDGPPNHGRITSTSPPPDVSNFSLIRLSTGEEFIREPQHTCSLNSGGGGWSRRGLTTLYPKKPLVNGVDIKPYLLTKLTAENVADGESFRLRLRKMGMWWHYGTVDEIFQGERTLPKWPGGPTLPLVLGSEDEVVLKVEDEWVLVESGDSSS